MFRDRAILRLPQPFRVMLAWWIAKKRAPVAREIYRALGGGSPIREETEAQATALEKELGEGYKVFIAMRYTAPRAAATARDVRAYAPQRLILLPLYPQFSTATTASSLREWKEMALGIPAAIVCCYPNQKEFIAAHVALLREALALAPGARVLFSAHGLPRRIAENGDPYVSQIKQSVEAIAAVMGADMPEHVICYQSRVGRLEWTGPATEAEIARAGKQGKSLIVVPVSFVSEHAETLVELDRDYADLAKRCGVPRYIRVRALGTHPLFIAGLAALCRQAAASPACTLLKPCINGAACY